VLFLVEKNMGNAESGEQDYTNPPAPALGGIINPSTAGNDASDGANSGHGAIELETAANVAALGRAATTNKNAAQDEGASRASNACDDSDMDDKGPETQQEYPASLAAGNDAPIVGATTNNGPEALQLADAISIAAEAVLGLSLK
jgi:hypothetical protein